MHQQIKQMEEKTGFMQSVAMDGEGHKLFYRSYFPKEETLGTLVVLHGMQEHSGRYETFARYMCEQGFAVVTYDHLGHGKTAVAKDDHGYIFDKNAKEQMIIDAENVATYLEHKFPTVPHFLLGHSMGSFVARGLLQRIHQQFDGAIIVGTGGSVKGIGAAKILTSILNKWWPRKRNIFLNKQFSKVNCKRFKHEENMKNTNWLSVDLANRQAFLDDELCGIPFTYNGFDTLVSLNKSATKRDWAAGFMRKFPMLFVSGADDPIGDFGKGIHHTVDQLIKDGFTDVEMKLYENKRHEILNEGNKFEVFETITNWMKARI